MSLVNLARQERTDRLLKGEWVCFAQGNWSCSHPIADQGPPGMSAAERKLERLFKTGEQLISQGNVAQAELAYIEALEVVQELPEPTIASFLETVLSTRVAQTCERQGKYEEAEKYLLRYAHCCLFSGINILVVQSHNMRAEETFLHKSCLSTQKCWRRL